MNIPTTSTNIAIGDLTGKAISEWEGAVRMDTEIKVSAGTLCYVSGEEYNEFMEKLQTLIIEYRI